MLGEGETRKSARIEAIEAEKKKKKLERDANVTSSASGQTDLTSKRGIRKRKSLAEVGRTSVSPSALQVGGEEKNVNHSIGNGALQSGHPLPEKRFLDNAIDILQRTDRRDLFAHPVDADVKDYYVVIEEPMDFSTLRAKLWTESYRTLEEFEYDVLLISENAMYFNGENTVYYKQARVLFELSNRVLETLKRDPEKLEQLERDLSQEQRRPMQRSRGKTGNSFSDKRIINRGKPRVYRSLSSNLLSDQKDSELTSGSQGHGPTFISARDSYRPSEFIVSEPFDGPKTLVLGDGFGIGYKDSLMKFVKNLGPVAQRVAAEKLIAMVPNLQTAPSPPPAAASCLQDTTLFETSSPASRPSSSGVWLGTSFNDKGKNVIFDYPPPSADIIYPTDQQFLQEFMNNVRSNTAALRFDISPTPVRDERFQHHLNFFNQSGSNHLSEAGSLNLNNHITGSHLHNQWFLGSSRSSLHGATPTNIMCTTKPLVQPSTYLRPSRFSRTWDSSNHGGQGQVNHLSPIVEPSRSFVQPMGSYIRLLTMDEENMSDQEAQSAAAVHPMIQWDQIKTSAHLVCHNSCTPSDGSISCMGMGMGAGRYPYPQRFGLNQPGMEEETQVADSGATQVYGQWRNAVSRGPQKQQRELMPPPAEWSKRPPPPPGCN